MGGERFTLVKVRKNYPKGDYSDPGWCNHPLRDSCTKSEQLSLRWYKICYSI